MIHRDVVFPEMNQPWSDPEFDQQTLIDFGAHVVLYDDEIHTFDEVISQLIKATGCSMQQAESLTLEVHNTGKAIVYDGDIGTCLRVSSILEEIALHTQVVY